MTLKHQLKIQHPITETVLKSIIEYDPISGKFTWIAKIACKTVIGSQAGSIKEGYRFIRISGKAYREHQLAFLYMRGFFPFQVDHIDHDGMNNSWANLEESDYQKNGKNHPKTSRNSTGFVGVSLRSDGMFISRVFVNKKHKFLGSFHTLEEAIEKRKQANIQFNFHINHGN